MKKNNKHSLKTLILIALLSCFTGLALAVKLDWIGPSRAEKKPSSSEEFMFGGTTPRSFSDLAERVQSAVVNISTTKTFRVRRGPYYEFYGDYFRKNFPEGEGQVKRPNSLGSGFILDKEGYILTNNHVVQGADEIVVKLADGRSFQARVIGTDQASDLAVIKVDARESLPMVRLGDSDQLKIGDWVVAIGNPFGLTTTVTAGILSAKGRVIGAGPYDNFLQTDASINPGNSGGPLFNLRGEVVGVNTAIIAGGQGIGFAIPVNQAKALIPQLIEKGKVQRGYLGIGLQELTPDLAKSYGLSQPQGVLVGTVYQNSPAHQAGIQAGDIILSFNDKEIKRGHDLPIFVSQAPVGSEAKIRLLRKGKSREVTVRLSSLDQAGQPAVSSLGESEASSEKLGLEVRGVSPLESENYGLEPGQGVTVTGVKKKSPADAVGLKPGDLILEINDKEVEGAKQFIAQTERLKAGEVVRMYVRRGPLASYFAFSL